MAPLLFVLLLILPLAELWVLIKVAGVIGLLPSLALLLGISMAGAWLLKREGMATWRRLQETIQRGGVPAKEVTDGALILLGGALLLTPGFITDVAGLLLVFPPTRALVKTTFRRFIGGLAMKRVGAVGYAGRTGKRVYDARVVRSRTVKRNDAPPLASETPRPAEPTEEP